MTDRPIPFSPPMMCALLREIAEPGTGKTQTRRVLKRQPEARCDKAFIGADGICRFSWPTELHPISYARNDRRLPFAVGDRLWVREAWRTAEAYDDLKPRDMGGDEPVKYLSDDSTETWGWKIDRHLTGRLRPPMFMPRWASRVTLAVTDVRVQRVQDISGEDCAAEGACEFAMTPPTDADREEARDAFRILWDSLNVARGYGWEANPWVVAVTFTPELRNIDQVQA